MSKNVVSLILAVLVSAVAWGGCVSQAVHTQALTELEQARIANESAKKAHEALTAKLAAANDELAKMKQRVDQLANELATTNQDATRTRQENEAAAAELRKQQDSLKEAQEAGDRMRLEQQRLKAALEAEQTDKEREIQRLKKTQADLAKSLEAEIANGEIRIRQVADRLMINMVDRVLFDSGQGHVKPAGLKILKQVSDILKNVKDKQVRIEGHTDNVKIGGRLKDRFPTNWELSTTRATSVVRFLVDEGGVDPGNISAVGYAETRPIASNDNEEGRTANRRIEIVLYPKDLKQVVSDPTDRAEGVSSAPRPH
jgi:chemotaxis protein MotB